MYKRDSLIIVATVSGVASPNDVSRVLVLLETGDYKEINNPETLYGLKFEWSPEETAIFPIRRIGVRLIVELVDNRRFTIAQSSFQVKRQFKEEEV